MLYVCGLVKFLIVMGKKQHLAASPPQLKFPIQLLVYTVESSTVERGVTGVEFRDPSLKGARENFAIAK